VTGIKYPAIYAPTSRVRVAVLEVNHERITITFLDTAMIPRAPVSDLVNVSFEYI